MSRLSSDTIHASCVLIGERAVLLAGKSGVGKSDLALRLIDRGARLVSDDYTILRRRGGKLHAAPPATIAGKIEVRGVALLTMPHVEEAEVSLLVDLDDHPERLPEAATRVLVGVTLPVASLAPLEPSAAIKVELLLGAIPR